MAEPIAALIVRILADTSEMVTGVKNVSGQLDSLESKVGKFGKAIAGVFTVAAAVRFAKEIVADIEQIDNAAKRLGESSEEFQRFSYAVKQSGGDVDGATTAIMSLTDKLGSGDAGLFNVLRKLNINLDEFKAKGAAARFVELAQAINGVSDPTKQLELRLEALGIKGVAALTAVNAEYKNLAENAPIYSEESIQALKRMGDEWDTLWRRIKVGAAESALAIKDFLDPSKTQILDENGAPKFFSGDGSLPAPPRGPNNQPAPLGLGGVDPNDVAALAVAYADLDLQAKQASASQRDLKEAWDSSIAVLKMLKIEAPTLSDALGQLMDRMGASTKVDHFTNRIIDQAKRIAALTRETERLMEVINPGSSKLAGDDVDAAIFDLRSDSRNWGKDGNLTAQALEIEHRLINNFSLQQMANQMTPSPIPGVTSGGSSVPGRFASVMNPSSITINAQGSFMNNPDSLNQLARLVGDQLAKRAGLETAYSRR